MKKFFLNSAFAMLLSGNVCVSFACDIRTNQPTATLTVQTVEVSSRTVAVVQNSTNEQVVRLLAQTGRVSKYVEHCKSDVESAKQAVAALKAESSKLNETIARRIDTMTLLRNALAIPCSELCVDGKVIRKIDVADALSVFLDEHDRHAKQLGKTAARLVEAEKQLVVASERAAKWIAQEKELIARVDKIREAFRAETAKPTEGSDLTQAKAALSEAEKLASALESQINKVSEVAAEFDRVFAKQAPGLVTNK